MNNMKFKYLNKTKWNDSYEAEQSIKVDTIMPKMHVVNDGFILPTKSCAQLSWGKGGVLDENKIYQEFSGIPTAFGGYYEFDQSNVQSCNETVIFIGILPKQIGHFFIDTLCRMWFQNNIDFNNYRIAFCAYEWDENPLEDKFGEAFSLLGIEKERLLHIKEPMAFSKILIPEPTMSFGGKCNIAYKNIIDWMIAKANEIETEKKTRTYSKIYFNKRFYFPANVKQVGEKEIEKIFSENDFTVISPEKMSLSEMIYLVNKCNYMACLSGTTSHYSMFHGNNFHLISLNRLPEPLRPQFRIDAIFNITNDYVDVYNKNMLISGNEYGKGVIWVECSDNLIRFMEDNGYKTHVRYTGFVNKKNKLEFGLKNIIYRMIPLVKKIIGR